MALMAQFPAKSMALSKVIKRGNKTIEELQKEHEELSPDLQKCSTDKIDSIKAIHCVVEGIKQTFVAFHGALQEKAQLEDDDIDSLREMITTMNIYSKALCNLYEKPYLSFERLKEMASWVTKNPKVWLASLGGAGGVCGFAGYGLVHAVGCHTGVATFAPLLVGAVSAPLALGALCAGAALILGLLALGVAHVVTYGPEETPEVAHRKRLEALIKKIRENDVLTVAKIVELRTAFERLVDEASTPLPPDDASPPIPPHDACLVCLENFEPRDRRNSRRMPVAAGGCTHHFCHSSCYQEWHRSARAEGCVVCRDRDAAAVPAA